METRVIPIDSRHPSPEAIAEAAALIRSGELVAFPTETVYGLGADALSVSAIEKVYAAKGRPQKNPLIAHVASVEQAKTLTDTWPQVADTLAKKFWPGPLTLVLRKKDGVPDALTGGGDTVAIRLPAHPVARDLILKAGVPIAAPSANRSGSLSPSEAAHVLGDLNGRIPMILDGGPVTGGIESTVIDVSGTHPALLRPGLLSLEEIEKVIGPVERPILSGDSAHALKSPGLLTRHYAPRTPLVHGTLVDVEKLLHEGKRIGFIHYSNTKFDHKTYVERVLPAEPTAYAHDLYRALHELDSEKLDVIVAELPPEKDAWLGVRDRLERAAA